MNYNSDNNDNNFFSYTGTLNRKNYFINLLILVTMFILLMFVNINAITSFTNFKIISDVLSFVVQFLQFVIVMAILSVIYRRLQDIAKQKSYEFSEKARKFFIIVYVFPMIYFILRGFIDFIPALIKILDLLMLFGLIPFGLICSVIICFIKGK